MPSRVIHVRIDDRVIAGCINFLRANQVKVEPLPMSTAVNMTLQSFIEGLQEDGEIPELSEVAASRLINEVFGRASAPEVAGVGSSAARALARHLQGQTQAGNHQAGGPSPKLDRDQLQDTLHSATDYTVPDGEIEVREVSEPPRPQVPPKGDRPPWANMELIPFSQIAEQYPKDVWVDTALEKGDVVLMRALEIIHSQTPVQAQHPSIVEKLLRELGPMLKPWEETIKEEMSSELEALVQETQDHDEGEDNDEEEDKES